MTMLARLFDVDHAESEDSDQWFTPSWIFDGLGLTFDLDVASPAGGVPWLPARHYLTTTDDGLATGWHGLVWCNPPYSDPLPWAKKWAQHPDGCLLIRADLSTGAGCAAMESAHGMYVSRGRLQFIAGAGQVASSTNFSTVLLTRGATCTAAIGRLAAIYGGIARTLAPVAA